jgi:hypothetical protein
LRVRIAFLHFRRPRVQTAGFLLIADIAAKSIETFAASFGAKRLARVRYLRRQLGTADAAGGYGKFDHGNCLSQMKNPGREGRGSVCASILGWRQSASVDATADAE